jgi:hypothetical protein
MFLIARKIIFIIMLLMFSLHADVFEGYTLFTPITLSQTGAITHLMNTNEEIIHTWSHERGPASMPYLQPDGSIIYPYRVEFPTMESGGVGGGVQKLTWDGTIIWDYVFSDDIYQHHHDVEPLPSGNILIIVWENKSAEDAYAMGRQVIENALNQMWSTAILELEPESGEIVWEWHLWDHLIQDIDAELPNYGVISEHPELFDINCGVVGTTMGEPGGATGDWMHINAVDYNPDLDQIVMSSRRQDEIFIIDHSTTTEAAASHTGGNSGKGGDLLYRWGNPQNYDRGTSADKILGIPHSVNWIPSGYPGAGHLILLNNIHDEPFAAVLEIITPIDTFNDYIFPDDEPYEPESWEWIYMDGFMAPLQGGAFRLPNGNTLITLAVEAEIFEVDMDGNKLWTYIYSENEADNYAIARSQKYSMDYLDATLLGDMNSDGLLNVLDIVSLVNIILSGETDPLGDVNLDGDINVLDVVILVNIILAS